MIKALSVATALALGALALPASAAPVGNISGLVEKPTSAAEQVRYRRCWWHHGHRHCRWYGGHHYWGYGPSVGLYYGGHRRHWGHRHHWRHRRDW